MEQLGKHLTGTHRIRAVKSALHKAKKLWPNKAERMEVRRQTLKLRFWGERHLLGSDTGIFDLSYEPIRTMKGSGVFELRLDDEIGGHRNIRVIFFVPPDSLVSNAPTPLPMIWVLETIPKRRPQWTVHDIDRFWAVRTVVEERFYT